MRSTNKTLLGDVCQPCHLLCALIRKVSSQDQRNPHPGFAYSLLNLYLKSWLTYIWQKHKENSHDSGTKITRYFLKFSSLFNIDSHVSQHTVYRGVDTPTNLAEFNVIAQFYISTWPAVWYLLCLQNLQLCHILWFLRTDCITCESIKNCTAE